MRISTKGLKRAVAPVLFLVVGAVGGALQAGDLAGQKGAEGEKGREMQRLPEGAGRALILQVCVQCHDFKVIVSQRKTREGWRRTINEMIWRGAPLLGDEAETITHYLATAFGPDAPSPTATAKVSDEKEGDRRWDQYLPAGEGRALALRACVRCHDLKTVVEQRKTADGWQRSVNGMIKLGAQLTASEAKVVIRYLADSFGPEVALPEELRKP